LKSLHSANIPKAVDYLARCRNFDGGFGNSPGAESHAGQVFCCVGALAIAGAVKTQVDADLLGWWLAERQTKDGGLNGRPEKLSDVCYSWWVLSSLAVLDRLDWIDRQKLTSFIYACQDPDGGGIADKPGNVVDVYHTFFGVAGLSLMGHAGLKPVDPVYALPVHVVQRLGLRDAQKH